MVGPSIETNMQSRVHSDRITRMNTVGPFISGKYILYWMHHSVRSKYNLALDFAIEQANQRNVPVVVVYSFYGDIPDLNQRHYAFILQALQDVTYGLAAQGISFICMEVKKAPIHWTISQIVRMYPPIMVVCDMGYLAEHREWIIELTRALIMPLVRIEANAIIPVQCICAKPLNLDRRKIPDMAKKLTVYLRVDDPLELKNKTAPEWVQTLLQSEQRVDVSDWKKALKKVQIQERSVTVAPRFIGGETQAQMCLASFKLWADRYKGISAHFDTDTTTRLGAYLNYGHLSPLQVVSDLQKEYPAWVLKTFLEDVVAKREIANHHCWYFPYKSLQCLNSWALKNLLEYDPDEREHLYDVSQFENYDTHDNLWNAAQFQLVHRGRIPTALRPYWGKKILEWGQSYVESFNIAIYLNNKYEVDGGFPSSWLNVAWCFGAKDVAARSTRPIYGRVRGPHFVRIGPSTARCYVTQMAAQGLKLQPEIQEESPSPNVPSRGSPQEESEQSSSHSSGEPMRRKLRAHKSRVTEGALSSGAASAEPSRPAGETSSPGSAQSPNASPKESPKPKRRGRGSGSPGTAQSSSPSSGAAVVPPPADVDWGRFAETPSRRRGGTKRSPAKRRRIGDVSVKPQFEAIEPAKAEDGPKMYLKAVLVDVVPPPQSTGSPEGGEPSEHQNHMDELSNPIGINAPYPITGAAPQEIGMGDVRPPPSSEQWRQDSGQAGYEELSKPFHPHGVTPEYATELDVSQGISSISPPLPSGTSLYDQYGHWPGPSAVEGISTSQAGQTSMFRRPAESDQSPAGDAPTPADSNQFWPEWTRSPLVPLATSTSEAEWNSALWPPVDSPPSMANLIAGQEVQNLTEVTGFSAGDVLSHTSSAPLIEVSDLTENPTDSSNRGVPSPVDTPNSPSGTSGHAARGWRLLSSTTGEVPPPIGTVTAQLPPGVDPKLQPPEWTNPNISTSSGTTGFGIGSGMGQQGLDMSFEGSTTPPRPRDLSSGPTSTPSGRPMPPEPLYRRQHSQWCEIPLPPTNAQTPMHPYSYGYEDLPDSPSRTRSRLPLRLVGAQPYLYPEASSSSTGTAPYVTVRETPTGGHPQTPRASERETPEYSGNMGAYVGIQSTPSSPGDGQFSNADDYAATEAFLRNTHSPDAQSFPFIPIAPAPSADEGLHSWPPELDLTVEERFANQEWTMPSAPPYTAPDSYDAQFRDFDLLSPDPSAPLTDEQYLAAQADIFTFPEGRQTSDWNTNDNWTNPWDSGF